MCITKANGVAPTYPSDTNDGILNKNILYSYISNSTFNL